MRLDPDRRSAHSPAHYEDQIFRWGNMSRITLAAAAASLLFSAFAVPAAAQAPAAAEHNDYSKSQNWLCWPGRADACAIDNTATVVKAERAFSKATAPASSPGVATRARA